MITQRAKFLKFGFISVLYAAKTAVPVPPRRDLFDVLNVGLQGTLAKGRSELNRQG